MGEIRGLLVISCLGVAALGAGIASAERMLLNENYNVLPISVSDDNRLDAYVPYMQAMKRLPDDDIENLRKISDSVITDLRSGRLQPLLSAYHGEETIMGPKGQWLNELSHRCATLLKSAHEASAAGKKDSAIADAVRVAGLLESVRFCSFQSLLKTSAQTRQSLEIIEANLPGAKTLPSAVKVWFRTKPHQDSSLEALEKRSGHLQAYYVARYPSEDAVQTDLDLSIRESSKLAHRFSQSEKAEKMLQVASVHGFASQR